MLTSAGMIPGRVKLLVICLLSLLRSFHALRQVATSTTASDPSVRPHRPQTLATADNSHTTASHVTSLPAVSANLSISRWQAKLASDTFVDTPQQARDSQPGARALLSDSQDVLGRTPELKMAAEGAFRRAAQKRIGILDHVPGGIPNPMNKNLGIGDQINWMDVWGPLYHCPLAEHIGQPGDGGKWVCGVSNLLRRPNCIIYSLGSEGDFTFEEEALKRTTCDIHIFDPTVRPSIVDNELTKINAQFDKPRVFYHFMAIWHQNSDNMPIPGRKCYAGQTKLAEAEAPLVNLQHGNTLPPITTSTSRALRGPVPIRAAQQTVVPHGPPAEARRSALSRRLDSHGALPAGTKAHGETTWWPAWASRGGVLAQRRAAYAAGSRLQPAPAYDARRGLRATGADAGTDHVLAESCDGPECDGAVSAEGRSMRTSSSLSSRRLTQQTPASPYQQLRDWVAALKKKDLRSCPATPTGLAPPEPLLRSGASSASSQAQPAAGKHAHAKHWWFSWFKEDPPEPPRLALAEGAGGAFSMARGPHGDAITNCRAMTLPDIVKTLGHDWIDLLKMDVEGSEYQAFHYLSTLPGDQLRFTQLALEVHQNMRAGYPNPNMNENVMELLHTFLTRGYRTFSVEPNIYFSGGTCTEFALIRMDDCGNVVARDL